jgi:hypothetical protein
LCPLKAEALVEYKKAIEDDTEFKKVPNRAMCIGIEMSQEQQAKVLPFLDKNNGVFA